MNILRFILSQNSLSRQFSLIHSYKRCTWVHFQETTWIPPQLLPTLSHVATVTCLTCEATPGRLGAKLSSLGPYFSLQTPQPQPRHHIGWALRHPVMSHLHLCHLMSSAVFHGRKTYEWLGFKSLSNNQHSVTQCISIFCSMNEQEPNLILDYWGNLGFPGGSVGKNPPINVGDVGSIPKLGRKKRKKWQLTPVFLPEKYHRQSSQGGCSPWGRQEAEGLSDYAQIGITPELRNMWHLLFLANIVCINTNSLRVGVGFFFFFSCLKSFWKEVGSLKNSSKNRGTFPPPRCMISKAT